MRLFIITLITILMFPTHVSSENDITLSGTLHIILGTSIDGQHTSMAFILFSEDHQIFQLEISNYANNYNITNDYLKSLDNNYVNVQGKFRNDGIFEVYYIDSIQAAAMVSNYSSLVSGTQSWVTILARFSDDPSTPVPPDYFNNLLYSNLPTSVRSYWRETSYGMIDMVGNTYGWYNLAFPLSYYSTSDTFCTYKPRFDLILSDMTALADPEVNFNEYVGINLVYNRMIGNCIWGGSSPLSRDGSVRIYGVTWMAYPLIDNSYFAHEQGHGFGLDHSSGPYDDSYDSDWDVMSNAGNCRNASIHGCMPVHTIAYHKAKLGWIPESNIYIPNNSYNVVDLYPLDTLTNGYMMIKIPISENQFYTVEYRRQSGFDAGIPGNAVIIHKVDELLSDRQARVVDVDNNGNPNDEGAMWHEGEVFKDDVNKITIRIQQNLDTHYRIVVTLSRLNLNNFVTSFITMNGTYELNVMFVLGDSNPHGPYGWGAMVNDLIGSIGVATKLGQLSYTGNSIQVLDTQIATYDASSDTVSINWNLIDDNMLVVGGPAVNLITYEYDKNGACPFYLTWDNNIPYIHSELTNNNYTFNIGEDYAVICFTNHNGKDILLVWGLTHRGTMAATQLLQYYDNVYADILQGGSSMIIRWNDYNNNGLVDIDDMITRIESW